MDAIRRPKLSATTPNASAPIGRPSRVVMKTSEAEDGLFAGIESGRLEVEQDGRQHHRRQVDIEHIDEFREHRATDGSATLLLPVRGFGDEPRR
jgi:hypothetical protein